MIDALTALRQASAWLEILIDYGDIDPADTTIKVKVEPGGKEVAEVRLSDTQALIADQIAALSAESAE